MNRRIVTMSIVIGLLAIGLAAAYFGFGGSGDDTSGSSNLSWVTLDEGMRLARQTNKKVLIDVYTDWCSWCKKMDKEVYTTTIVQDIIRARFVPVRLNAESSNQVTYNGTQLTETRMAQEMGVTGYPTTVFLDAGGQPITKVAGYMQSKEFANLLRFIGEDHFRTTSYDEFLSKQDPSNLE